MLSDYTVDIIRKDRNGSTTSEKSVPIEAFCTDNHFLLIGLIKQIEDVISQTHGNKRTWPPQIRQQFEQMRHELLDVANNFNRLPHSVRFKGHKIDAFESSEFIASIFNKAK